MLQVLAVVAVAEAAAEAPSPLLGFADAFVRSFDLLLPRLPHSSWEVGPRQMELMASFPHCIPAPLSSARRDRDAAETSTEPADPDDRCPTQPEVESFPPG